MIVKWMTDMLRGGKNSRFQGPFIPSMAMWQSLRQLKVAYTLMSILVHFNQAKLIWLEIDTSGYVIAGIASQQVREVQEAKEGLNDYTKCAAKGH